MGKLRDKVRDLIEHQRAMQASPQDYSLLELVQSYSRQLDDIFAAYPYTVTECANAMVPGSVVEIATQGFVATIVRDANFFVGMNIRIFGDGYDAISSTDAWQSFLANGRRTPRWPTDEHGWVVAAPKEMLEHGLCSLQQIWRELGNSPVKARDAMIYIDGYHAGYTSHFLADELPDQQA